MDWVKAVEDGFTSDGVGVDAFFNSVSLELFDIELIYVNLINMSWWDEAAPAGWPIWTAESGACDSYRRADDDEDNKTDEREPGQAVYNHREINPPSR